MVLVLDSIIVIPARLKSSRLPRKPLLDINGQSMIERTYRCALDAINDKERIIIATDSQEIKNECNKFNANCLLTSSNCLTGTDRVAEISRVIDADQYINLQGDEPIFPSSEIERFINISSKDNSIIHTATIPITKKHDFFNKSIPKLVFSRSKKLMYSSRAPIPHNKKGEFNFGFKHVCIYAFNKSHLDQFVISYSKTAFEAEEDLEINRFLELDIRVNCIELKNSGKAVDNIEDLEEVRDLVRNSESEN